MKERMTIKDLPSCEQPYEKALNYGVGALSDAELLAVIIRSGTKNRTSLMLAYDILDMSDQYPGLLGLYHLTREELCKIAGIGSVKATELMCIAELSKRMSRLSRMPSKILNSPSWMKCEALRRNIFMQHISIQNQCSSNTRSCSKARSKNHWCLRGRLSEVLSSATPFGS